MVNTLQSYFHKGTEKQNSSHWINYCKGCVKHEKKLLQDAGTFDPVDSQEGGQSFRDGELKVLPFIFHLLICGQHVNVQCLSAATKSPGSLTSWEERIPRRAYMSPMPPGKKLLANGIRASQRNKRQK
jgi:hypothetical protein